VAEQAGVGLPVALTGGQEGGQDASETEAKTGAAA